ncbi:MAG: zinc ABC transporter substrate-binding protein [Archaeoglobales archaeon]|nr:zinc ABC transporter substrate-binding protein [Archaeoglobales archaeon]
MSMRKCYPLFILILLVINFAEAKILVTLPELRSIAEEISGEEVEFILPPAVDPHTYALSSSDLEKIRGAELVLLANSNIIEFEKRIRDLNKNCLDFEDYNATILNFEGYGENYHAYWMYPENALKIAKKLAEKLTELRGKDYMQRYYEFEERVERAEVQAKSLLKENGYYVASDPHVAYILAQFVEVKAILFEEFTQIVDLRSLKVEKPCYIVLADYHRGTKVEEISKNFASENECKLAYTIIFSSLDYDATIIANAARISGAFEVEKPNYNIYLIASLALMAVVVVWLLWRKT